MKKGFLWFALVFWNALWILTALRVPDPWPLKGSSGEPSEEFTFDEHFFGRSLLVRLRNQVNYTLFGTVATQNAVEGPTHRWFEQSYLNAARGLDVLDTAEVSQRLARWAQWQTASGVPFTLVLAPGKAAATPQTEWPSDQRTAGPAGYFANYRAFRACLNRHPEWSVLDFVPRFAPTPPSAPPTREPSMWTFPRNGIHWSQAALTLATREWLRPEDGLRLVVLDTLPSAPFGTDDDLEQSLNLLQDLPDDPGYRLPFRWERTGKPTKILIIGDSFAWGSVRLGLLKNAGDSSEFWYYNRQRFGPQVPQYGADLATSYGWRSEEDWIRSLQTFDRVLWVVTDANLRLFPFAPPVPHRR